MSSFSTLSSLSSSSSDLEEEARASSYSCNQTQRRSYKAKLPGLESPRLGLAELLYSETFACKYPERSHFLDACFLCKKSLGRNRDIFMYRGDTPFCSEECRQEQIERDEAEERIHQQSLRMKSSAMKQSKKNQEKGNSATPPKSQPSNIRWRAGTVSVAG